jgi:hypothetical protein
MNFRFYPYGSRHSILKFKKQKFQRREHNYFRENEWIFITVGHCLGVCLREIPL